MANARHRDTLERLDLNSWKDGEVSSFYAARVPDSGLAVAEDVLVQQNGTAGDRGSFLRDNLDELPYPLLGNMYVYKTADGSENLICMLDNGTDGVIYVLSGTSWVAHSEITFDRTARACLVQSTSNVVIFNDVDAFSYYDITADTVKQFVAVTDPSSALTAVKSGLTGTGFDIYYTFSYTGNGGETELSPLYTNTLGKLRENWASTDYFTLTRPGTAPTGALDWNLFMVMVPSGSGTPTASDYTLIKESIPLATTVIVDNGHLVADTIRLAPTSNTTVGITAWYGNNIDGRIWAIHDHTIYWGGDNGSELTFGGAKGSGYHNIDEFGTELPMAIELGRDNSGASCINILTKGVAGRGSIYDVYFNTITISGTSVQGWEFKQRAGSDGTNAPFSVIRANNNNYYLSLLGFKSTGVKPGIVGIESTDIISNAIRDKVQLLTESDLSTCYSAYWNEMILWTVAYGTANNSQIWVYDILHGGIWTRWNVAADALFTWAKSGTDSAKLYIVKGQRVLYYQTGSIIHQDDGETFTSVMKSGLVGFEPDRREWAYLLQVIFVLLNPVGTVHFSVTAHTKRGDITKESPPEGVSFGGISNSIGWNAIIPGVTIDGTHNNKIHGDVYGTFSLTSSKQWQEVSLRFKKMVQYFSWKVWVEDKNSISMLSDVVPEYTIIGMDPDMLTRTDTIRI